MGGSPGEREACFGRGRPAHGLRHGRQIGQAKGAATHAATEAGELACGTWTRQKAPATVVGIDATTTSCRPCRANLGLDADANENRRLEALFVLSITLGLRPGELRKLAWDHVDLDNAVIHVWRSASRTGDVKTPKSKRSLELPKRAITALQAHRKRQAAERLAAGPPGRTPISSSATRTAACTPATPSTGASAR